MDLSELKGIISLMQKSDLTDLEIETQDLKLRLGRPGAGGVVSHAILPQAVPQPGALPAAQPSPVQPSADSSNNFKSPMVGTFYRKPSPDDAAFVQVGDQVNKGDILCIIEAMKVMNEIQADVSGEVTEIMADDGDSVEYGQPLFSIK
ncbi:MAG: acetyl-CoA carboxylase biotin carboxyl carrier protein [Opitutales bacterium]|nr:acetyl-CoA carboxylase biotin carboxyl carrier protein [Opitutales bacterium]